MRAIFFWLLLANVAFYAWMQYAPPIGEREPGRMKTQVNQEKIKLLLPDGAVAPVPAATAAAPVIPAVAVAAAPAPPPPPPKVVAEPTPPKPPERVCHAYPGIPANLARALQAEIVQTSPGLKAT